LLRKLLDRINFQDPDKKHLASEIVSAAATINIIQISSLINKRIHKHTRLCLSTEPRDGVDVFTANFMRRCTCSDSKAWERKHNKNKTKQYTTTASANHMRGVGWEDREGCLLKELFVKFSSLLVCRISEKGFLEMGTCLAGGCETYKQGWGGASCAGRENLDSNWHHCKIGAPWCLVVKRPVVCPRLITCDFIVSAHLPSIDSNCNYGDMCFALFAFIHVGFMCKIKKKSLMKLNEYITYVMTTTLRSHKHYAHVTTYNNQYNPKRSKIECGNGACCGGGGGLGWGRGKPMGYALSGQKITLGNPPGEAAADEVDVEDAEEEAPTSCLSALDTVTLLFPLLLLLLLIVTSGESVGVLDVGGAADESAYILLISREG
ncbi:hypothetical protein C0J52_26021, partial [Blattella germanica]